MKLIFILFFFVIHQISTNSKKISFNSIQKEKTLFLSEDLIFGWNQVQKLVGNNANKIDSFGTSVSISNDSSLIIIGAPDANLSLNDSQGKAYIFQNNGNEWIQVAELIASDGEEYDYFGTSVSISNDSNILLIGAPGGNVGNNDSQGKAYIFQNNGTIWNQIQILTASDGKGYDYFGNNVSISNDSSLILIGAPDADVGSNNDQGKAYIFQKNGNEWNQIQILTASDGKGYDYFGASISFSNDLDFVLIGAPYKPTSQNPTPGKVYIFERNGTNWNQSQILTASDGKAGDQFGNSVSISNDSSLIVIGAYYATVVNNHTQGKGYIFQKNGNQWNQSQILIASDGQQNDWFGTSIFLLNSSFFFISSSRARVGDSHLQGKVYTFKKNGSYWNESGDLISKNFQFLDSFGSSISASQNYTIIGAPLHDYKNGEVYVFQYGEIIPNFISSSSDSSSKIPIIVVSVVIPIIFIVGIISTFFFFKKNKKKRQHHVSIPMEAEMEKWILKEDK